MVAVTAAGKRTSRDLSGSTTIVGGVIAGITIKIASAGRRLGTVTTVKLAPLVDETVTDSASAAYRSRSRGTFAVLTRAR
jgi:hypothetical protein